MALTRIRQDRSNVISATPAAGDIEIGELFLNIADRVMYSKDASNIVFQVRGDAVNQRYDNVVSGLAATNVQDAIDALDNAVDQIVGTGVLSFNGRTGAVLPAANDYELNELSDVDIVTSPPNVGDSLAWDGAEWVPISIQNLFSANAMIEVPQTKSYTLVSDMVSSGTILKIVGRTGQGSLDVAVEIDGTPVTGAAGTLTTTEATYTATGANSISVGQRLTVSCTNLLAVQNAEFTVTIQR